MKVIYSNDTKIKTVVLDMRDVLVNNKFTSEIALEDLYKYVQIVDLSEIVDNADLISGGAGKIIKMIFNNGRDGDLKFNNDFYRNIVLARWKKYMQSMDRKFEIDELNYYNKLVRDSVLKAGIEYIPIEAPKSYEDRKRDRKKANRGEMVDEINVDIPLWEKSKQLITVFKNPDNDNNLRYAYAGIKPNEDKDYKKSNDNGQEDDYSL